jgi:hypothetical protein
VSRFVSATVSDPPLSPLDPAKFKPTPWEAYTYDPNDNAGRTHADEKPHSCYLHHHNTPASIEVDALGRTDWNLKAPRVDWAAPPANLLDTRIYETRSAFDALGPHQVG